MRWRLNFRTALLTLAVALPILALACFGIAVLITPLPAPENPEASKVVDATGETISRLFTENRVELPVVEMPQALLDAVVAVEDDRFYQHRGIDPLGVARAFIRNLQAARVIEGGSTLTQQLAKNLYLTHDRTLTRKFKEAVLTVKLESTYSKKEILGMYWNTIYLGRGAYGVEVAAQTYFGKSARDLTLTESALMAALPRSPEYYSPYNDAEAAVLRRNLVLDKMMEHAYISAATASAAKEEPLRLVPAEQAGRTQTHTAPYWVDHVLAELRTHYPAVAEEILHGGYTIHTSLDLNLQRAAEEAVIAEAPAATPDENQVMQPQVALVAMESTTGYIRAFIGGREQRAERNRVTERQQPGSAFKPFVYAAALETRTSTAASTQTDEPAAFPGAREGEAWRPANYGNRYSYKPETMRTALRRSLNVVTVKWMDAIKPGPVVSLARRMGIESEMPANLTISLGSADVTPLELTRAYAPLANGGFAVTPVAIVRITDRHGNIIAEESPARQRAMDPGVAFIVTDMLREVVRPGGTAAQVSGYLGGRPAAGKTGTSDQSRDAWFVGYTPDLVAGVWVGRDDNSPTRFEGGTAAAPIWANFMSRALQGKPHRDWSPPANVAGIEYCTLTGLLPNASCPTGHEWFLTGTEPAQVDPTIHWDTVLPQLPGMPWTPPGTLPPGAAEP